MATSVPATHAVIVGAGVAGTSCALHLHHLCPSIHITLVDPNPTLTVCRALTRLTSEQPLDVAVGSADAKAWCDAHNMTYVRARAVTLRDKQLVMQSTLEYRAPASAGNVDDGGAASFGSDTGLTALPFQTLCIASGARPAVPPALVVAVAKSRALVVRDAASVTALRAALSRARHAVVVGAGGIGMEVVHEADCAVTWVVRDGSVGAAFLDDAVVTWLRDSGGDRGEKKCQMAGTETGTGTGTRTGTGVDTENDQGVDATSVPVVHSLARTHDRADAQDLRYGSANVAGAPANVPCAAAVGPDWLGRRVDGVMLPDKGDVPTPRCLPGQGKRHVRVESERAVVDVMDARATEAEPHDLRAVLSDGSTLGCDVVVVATGVWANTEWLRGSAVRLCGGGQDAEESSEKSGLEERDRVAGVVVRAGVMQSSVPGVFAGGDCASVRACEEGAESSDWLQVRTWGQALSGGRAAACGMAEYMRGDAVGGDGVASGVGLEFEVFAHATRFFGQRVVMLGRWRAQGLGAGYRVLERGGKHGFVRAVVKDGRVRGAVLAGDVDKAEAFENLIAGRLDVTWLGSRLVDAEFELEEFFD